MDNEEDKNVIVELNNDIEDTLFDEDLKKIKESTNELVIKNEVNNKNKKGKEKKVKKEKVKKEFFYKRLSKKGKIIFIVSISLIVLIITGLLLYFLVFNKPKKKTDVVVKSTNYMYKNGTLIFYDKASKEIGRYECNVKKVKECKLADFTKEDDFDAPKMVNLDNEELILESQIYNNMYVFVQDGEEINLYDLKSNKNLGEYKLIKESKNPLKYIVAKDMNDKYGIINISTTAVETILPFEYSYLGISDNDKVFVAKEENESYLVDKDKKELSKKVPGEIRKFSEKYISLYKDNKYYLYNYEGNDALKFASAFIDFYEDFVFIVSEGKLTAYSSELVLLNQKGIALNSIYYNPLNRVNENGENVETLKAFEFTYENGIIKVKLFDQSTKEINVYEALVNKRYNYVNYSDGFLYFYKDLDKKELLGKYECTNKNKLLSEAGDFTNCFVAKESGILNKDNNGFSPIISNRYVFIYDNQTGSTITNINLYDFVKGQISVKYQAVDTGYGSENITHIESTDKNVVAKNMSDYYGMITINKDGPHKILSFGETINNKLDGTKSISRFDKDYYLVKRVTYNYLYTLDGVEVVKSQFDIISKTGKYLVVYDSKNKEYLLYSLDKGKIISDTSKKFNLLELYNDFYLGTYVNKLYLYKYSDTTAYPMLGIDLPTNYKELKVDTENKKIIITDIGNQKTTYLYTVSDTMITIQKEEGGEGEGGSE